jgi:transcriptional regulator EpsA
LNDTPRLSEIDRERFTDAVEASYAVSIRPQFFTWSQSVLQGVLPHEVLICGVADGSNQGMTMHRFSASRYFRQEQFNAVCDPAEGLLPRLLAAAEGGRTSVVTSPADPRRTQALELHALVRDQELVNLVAQLVLGARGKVEAFYAFARLGQAPDARTAYVAELVVPHVHSAFIRVLANERQVLATESRRAGRIITRRQEEILNHIKAGKTNFEIAEALGCSPWTIKNHIQVILRKLDTHSRTHAIARAISLGILQSD